MARPRLLPAVTLVLAAVAAAPAWSQPTVRPGQWEIRHTLRSSSGELERAQADAQRQIAAMPPEQRKMMQEMLGRQGVAMGSGGPPHVFICISPEAAAGRLLPFERDKDCTVGVAGFTATTIDLRFSCASPPSSGTGHFTVHTPEHYSGRWDIVDGPAARPGERMQIDIQARWVGPNCTERPAAGAPAGPAAPAVPPAAEAEAGGLQTTRPPRR